MLNFPVQTRIAVLQLGFQGVDEESASVLPAGLGGGGEGRPQGLLEVANDGLEDLLTDREEIALTVWE